MCRVCFLEEEGNGEHPAQIFELPKLPIEKAILSARLRDHYQLASKEKINVDTSSGKRLETFAQLTKLLAVKEPAAIIIMNFVL